MHPTTTTTLLLSLPLFALAHASPKNAHPAAREVVNAPPAALPIEPTQVSPVTTMLVWEVPAPGAPARQVQVVYSQAFDAVPDQWEAPQAGDVGMGDIKGEVGVIKSHPGKRMMRRTAAPEPTAAAVLRDAKGLVKMGLKEKREAEAAPFLILPPVEPAVEGVKVLEKRKGGKGGKSSGGGGGDSAAPGRLGVGAGMVVLFAAAVGLVLA